MSRDGKAGPFAYAFLIVARKKYGETTPDLAHDIVESAQQLVHLEIALAKQEVKELAISNGVAAGALAGAAVFALLAVLVALPVLLVVAIPAHSVAALVWLILCVVLAAGLALFGKSKLRIEAPKKTIESLKETKAWALHLISSTSK